MGCDLDAALILVEKGLQDTCVSLLIWALPVVNASSILLLPTLPASRPRRFYRSSH